MKIPKDILLSSIDNIIKAFWASGEENYLLEERRYSLEVEGVLEKLYGRYLCNPTIIVKVLTETSDTFLCELKDSVEDYLEKASLGEVNIIVKKAIN